MICSVGSRPSCFIGELDTHLETGVPRITVEAYVSSMLLEDGLGPLLRLTLPSHGPWKLSESVHSTVA